MRKEFWNRVDIRIRIFSNPITLQTLPPKYSTWLLNIVNKVCVIRRASILVPRVSLSTTMETLGTRLASELVTRDATGTPHGTCFVDNSHVGVLDTDGQVRFEYVTFFNLQRSWELKNFRIRVDGAYECRPFALVTRRPYCPGRPKELCFTTPSLTSMVSTAGLGVVKQSSFGLPGQYGRRVTRVNCIHSFFKERSRMLTNAARYRTFSSNLQRHQ